MAIQKISGVTIELTSQASGDVAYFDGTDWVRLAKGEPGEVLTMNESETAPQWGPACLFTGTQTGYSCGGWTGPGETYSDNIQKYSLVTDGNSTDIGNLVFSRRMCNGHSSSTHGYVTSGYKGSPIVNYNQIDRFSFTTDGDATDWADCTTTMKVRAAPASSCTDGFTYGGEDGAHLNTNVIDKFPFASQTNATDWADAVKAQYAGAGCSSDTYGYAMGGVQHLAPGIPSGTVINSIERYPFATQTNATDVGDITVTRHTPVGVSSLTHGYCCGGTFAPAPAGTQDYDVIDRVSFATGGNATDHGDLTAVIRHPSAASSTTHGYVCGGGWGPSWSAVVNAIQKFAYASNTTATDVGDITIATDGMSGHQY